jgi:hypothetical protein
MQHFQLEVDFSFNAPDLVITGHGGINVEATVACPAQGSTPELCSPVHRFPTI